MLPHIIKLKQFLNFFCFLTLVGICCLAPCGYSNQGVVRPSSSVVVQSPSRPIISMAVGRVLAHVVTSREIQISQSLEQALAHPSSNRNKSPFVLKLEDLKSDSFAQQISWGLIEWAVFLEAKNMQIEPASSSEILQAEKKALSLLNQNPLWKLMRVTPPELRTAVERKLLAQKFIQLRVESSVIPVSDGEIQKYFEDHRKQFNPYQLDAFKEEIRARLMQEQRQKKLQDWFEVLLAKYKSSNFLV